MNTANKLTIFRVILVPVFLIVLYIGFNGSNYVALAIFIIASITDAVDGYIARSRKQITDFGKFLDPLADKILVIAAMLWFVETGVLPAWAVLIVIIREFAVTALRLVAASRGDVIAAGLSGKIKTVASMVCLIILFLEIPVELVYVCIAVIVATTVVSGVDYFVKNRKALDWEK